MSEFGMHLREARRAQRLTQRDLADIVGVDFTYICKLECGTMPPPSEAVLEKLVLILEADELSLYAGKVPGQLGAMCQGNPLLTELLMLLSKQRLPEETYRQMIALAKQESEATYETP